jgi:hypothetical protein
VYTYGSGKTGKGWYKGISDAIPYMNTTLDQWLLYVVNGIVVGYGNNADYKPPES